MKSVKCPQCGFVGWADAERCKKCGVEQLPDPDVSSNQSPETLGNYQRPYQSYGDQDLKKGLATASLVLGVLNLMIFGIFVVPSIVGIVCAVVAQRKIKRAPHIYGGQGFATAGLVTNIVAVAFIIPLLIIMAIAIPNLLAARRAANEGATISSLRKVHSAESTYQATVGNGAFATLDQLAQAGLLTSELAAATHYGYKFTVVVKPSGYEDPPKFQVVAVPLEYGSSGNRSFYIDESGVIRAENNHGAEATDLSPPLSFDGYSPSSPPRRYTDD
jgi:type IV pilus assembly protein PilA